MLSFIVISCGSQKVKVSDTAHLGFWSGYDCDYKLVTLTLNKDNTARLTADKSEMNNSFMIDDVEMSLHYQIDYTKNPIQLDLIIKNKQTGETHTVWEGIAV